MQQVAVVDANVIRVLARLRRLAGDQKSKSMLKLNAQLADSLVDPDRPGCFNQVGLAPHRSLVSFPLPWLRIGQSSFSQLCFERQW